MDVDAEGINSDFDLNSLIEGDVDDDDFGDEFVTAIEDPEEKDSKTSAATYLAPLKVCLCLATTLTKGCFDPGHLLLGLLLELWPWLLGMIGSPLHSLPCKVSSAHSTVHGIDYTAYGARYRLYILLGMVGCVQLTRYNIICTLYSYGRVYTGYQQCEVVFALTGYPWTHIQPYIGLKNIASFSNN